VVGPTRDTDHTCLQENIETAKLLDHDSKPCPKCASLIFRISGCPQMFCTNCHTGFNWNTGKIMGFERFHNPHYFAYRVQQNQINENEDLDCRVMPPIETIIGREKRILFDSLSDEIKSQYNNNIRTNDLRTLYKIKCSIKTIVNIHSHVENQIIQNQLQPIGNIAETNRPLRIQYLINEISEDDFRIMLQRQEKMENKKHDNLLVCQMFCMTVIDLVHRFMRDVETVEQYIELLHEFQELRTYVQNTLETVGKTYNCVTLKMGIDFNRYN
jgi:hypothetical protein